MIRVAAAIVLGMVLTVIVSIVVIPTTAWVESELFPAMKDWQPTVVTIKGNDIELSGTVVKSRSCKYLPPPRARDENGTHYIVESDAPTRTMTWAPSDEPQKFGSWRVFGVRGKELTFYQEHRCHWLWDAVVVLGTIKVKEN